MKIFRSFLFSTVGFIISTIFNLRRLNILKNDILLISFNKLFYRRKLHTSIIQSKKWHPSKKVKFHDRRKILSRLLTIHYFSTTKQFILQRVCVLTKPIVFVGHYGLLCASCIERIGRITAISPL